MKVLEAFEEGGIEASALWTPETSRAEIDLTQDRDKATKKASPADILAAVQAVRGEH